MKKFFLFRQNQIDAASVRASDTGIGMNLFVIAIDKLSFMTATKGEVQMVFDDATLYQETALYTGEAVEKTSVGVACNPGDELKLMDDVMKFMSSDKSVARFMRFDGLKGGYTSDYVKTDSIHNISPRVKANPINMQTGERSFGDADAVAANTIAGINFANSQPIIDYNHEGLSSVNDGGQINSWNNAGSGGSTYNINSNVGTPVCKDPTVTAQVACSTKVALLSEADHFIVPSFTSKNAYTVYAVFVSRGSAFGPFYGDAAGETLGFTGQYKEDGPAEKVRASNRIVSIRHAGHTGAPATITATESIPDLDTTAYDFEAVHVYVIRRDREGHLFIHNRDGEIIGTLDSVPHYTKSDAFHTDGNLKIQRLGTTGDIETGSFSGTFARFGVIDSDIGTNESIRLARDLFNLYKK